jgi:2-polyprenyl-3-methyl-5-hydroxy-6-metoxy-1,4-benzoquinol methylase
MKKDPESIAELLKEEALATEKKYKISYDAALEKLEHYFSINTDLVDTFESSTSIKQFKKSSVYKSFIKKTRESIYYSLRHYFDQGTSFKDLLIKYAKDGDPQSILATHASTRERASYADDFTQTVASITNKDLSVVDIGAGVFPLSLPLAQLPYKKYLAIENQKDSVEALKLYKEHLPKDSFEVFEGNFTTISWSEYLKEGELFDTAIMLKLISVVKRHSEEEFELLAKTPAKKYLVSIPKTSMTKNEDISRRETAIVHEFATLSQKTISQTFDFPDEILFVLS